jgi:FKBP-type peptidyl-prolyl cis-trans isomerase
MAQAYRVCAPYVTVYVNQPGGGETVLGFYEGGTLPESATKESIDSLLAKGMIEETDGPTPEEQAEVDAKAEKSAREKSDKAAEQVAAETKKAEDKKAADLAKKNEAAEKAAEKSATTTTSASGASVKYETK